MNRHFQYIFLKKVFYFRKKTKIINDQMFGDAFELILIISRLMFFITVFFLFLNEQNNMILERVRDKNDCHR